MANRKTIELNGKTYSYEEEHLDINNLNEITSKDAEEILSKATDLLQEIKVESYLAFGTLLGAVREKDFIKGDLDVDIYVRDENMMFENLHYLESKGLKLVRGIVNTLYSFRLNDKCYIDIYILQSIKRSIWSFYCLRLSTFYIPKKYFREIEEIEFKGRLFKCVKEPVGLLRFWYGDTWNVPISKFQKTYCYEVKSHYFYRRIIDKLKQFVKKCFGDKVYDKVKKAYRSHPHQI